MHWLVSDIWSVGIAIGPVLGYVYQYSLIHKNKTVGTFSIKLCGMLLFCNILRIGFYFFVKYSMALFVQSIFMIIVQLFLLRLCVNTMIQEGTLQTNDEQYDDQGLNLVKDFWNWNQLRKYYYVIGLFSISVLFFTLIFSHLKVVIIGQLIGYLSLVAESLLMLPQVLQNIKQKRVKGLSHLLVGLNNAGDLMKLGFFVVNDQPAQFVICGILQCFIDGFVIVQICYYKRQQPKVEQVQPQSQQIHSKPQDDKITTDDKQQKKPSQYNQFQDQS